MSKSKGPNKGRFEELDRKNQEALLGGGEKRIEQQHAKGKLTARERVQLLLDENSFEEMGKFVMHRSKDFGLDKEYYLGDGVVTGYGTNTFHLLIAERAGNKATILYSEKQAVKIGLKSDTFVEILDGLKENDRVRMVDFFSIKEGT